jgi:hypothetical protein
MNHLGPADDHRTEARRERSKKSPPRRGRRKDRPPAKDCATTSLEDLEAPYEHRWVRSKERRRGRVRERSEYEREERARGVDVWRRRSRGEERKAEEEGDVMAEVANETWKNGYIDDGRGQWIITGMAEDMEESGIDR